MTYGEQSHNNAFNDEAATPHDYATLKNILRIFTYCSNYNYDHKQRDGAEYHICSSSRGQDFITRYELDQHTDEFNIAPGWNMLADKISLGMNFVSSSRWNTVGSTYINYQRIDISGVFENDSQDIDGGKLVGVVAQYIKPKPNAPNTNPYDFTLSNEFPWRQENIIPIADLDLDSPDGEFSPALQTLYHQFMHMYRRLQEEEQAMGQMNQVTHNQTYRNKVKDVIAHAIGTQNPIFHGAPGTGKTFNVLKAIAELITEDNTDISQSTHQLRDVLQELNNPYIDPTITDIDVLKTLKKNPRFCFVQFHPSYDYTDFVEGLRPKADGNGFELQAGIFMKFCARARKDSKHTYYFLIDEINRGDVSNIFGELFFLLDSGYRGVGITTQYANLHTLPARSSYALSASFEDEYLNDDGEFDIPDNVVIIGTMNDIDRSVDSFDFAMRRRFHFIEITWEESIALRFNNDTETYPHLEQVTTLMHQLNTAIANISTLSRDYALGASYFVGMAKAQTDEEFAVNKQITWDNEIAPLLTEYLRGNPESKTVQDIQQIWDSQ